MRTLIIFLSLITMSVLAQTDRAMIPNAMFVVNNIQTGTATTTAVAVLTNNQNRKYLLIQNLGSENLYFSTEDFSDENDAIRIAPDGNYEPWLAPQNSIYLKTATATTLFSIVEGQ